MRYRLYLDESGDHTSSHESEVWKRYLGLVGTAFTTADHGVFRNTLWTFKENHCDECDLDDPPILHREDVLGKKPGFNLLKDDQRNRSFCQAFVRLVEITPFTLFSVVVDKHTHRQCTYRTVKHPYHYCLRVIVEKYVRFLESVDGTGDVLAESRGGIEDTALKQDYKRIYSYGTNYWPASVFRKRLSSKELKIKKKGADISGLQLADMIAFGSTRDVLAQYGLFDLGRLSYLDRQIVEAVECKYYQMAGARHPRINGLGRVILR